MPRGSTDPTRSRASLSAVIALVFLLAQHASAATSTTIVRYSPWHLGKLRSDLKVTQRVQGSCWTGSLAVTRSDAWRCMAQNVIQDPCFSAGYNVQEVVCVADPFSRDVTVMSLTKRLDRKAHGPNGESHAWMLQLENGAKCGFATGATALVAGMRLNYACTTKGWIAGNPDRWRPTWIANYVAAPNRPSIRKVAIGTAVF